MVLESTVVCIDNGEFMRNGDFVPTRLQAQQDAANLLIQCKLRSNPENCVGLLTLAPRVDLQVALTTDNGKLMSKLHQVQVSGLPCFLIGIRVAQLVLKHRQNRNHKSRIVIFVGSPVAENEDELIQLAKKLKKEKLQVDLIAFGEEENAGKLKVFIETLNGNDTGSHLVMVSAGSSLQEALLQSPILRGEDGSAPAVSIGSGGGFDFGIDPNEDPELAMALRVSLEEQRQRQEQEARRDTAAAPGAPEEAPASAAPAAAPAATTEAQMPNFEAMTEEEQMEYALQISMAQENAPAASGEQTADTAAPVPMEVGADSAAKPGTSDQKKPEEGAAKADDEDEIMSDPAAIEALLSTLPGVDPKSDEFRKAREEMEKEKKNEDKTKKDKPKK